MKLEEQKKDISNGEGDSEEQDTSAMLEYVSGFVDMMNLFNWGPSLDFSLNIIKEKYQSQITLALCCSGFFKCTLNWVRMDSSTSMKNNGKNRWKKGVNSTMKKTQKICQGLPVPDYDETGYLDQSSS